MATTKQCPWCAEEILTEARKCKHCGEYLDNTEGSQASATNSAVRSGGTKPSPSFAPVWQFAGFQWKCVTHQKAICTTCQRRLALPGRMSPPPKKGATWSAADAQKQLDNYTGKPKERRKLSEVGNTDSGQLACPKCGGTQFTAKRSTTGKVVGITTLGVGGLLAPKSQVRCVACGMMFKRG